MKTITMTLKKEWFDKILSGEKTIEYREVKKYWISRLWNKEVKTIIFKNGYGKNVPSLRADVLKIDVFNGLNTDLGIDGYVFAIYLANVRRI